MTAFAPEPVPSGRPYDISTVDGQPPSALDQFVGETTFGIAKDGSESQIYGIGSADEHGVRFQEKSPSGGKDVRTWEISEVPGRGFTAAATAKF